jgi:hypothetical protein
LSVDYEQGLKREVVEVKFLIHDLRIEKFINEVIHFHTTLNTDLEIHGITQAQAMHDDDLRELKSLAATGRRTFDEYSNAVRSFSPDRTVLKTGRLYVQNIYDICELILNPMWGRVDKVLSFLPEDSRSVLSRNHYRNCIHWICGVYYRIEHFLDEAEDIGTYEEFDLAADLKDFTKNVIHGYVAEKSSARVELQVGRLDAAVVGGNRHRFRRMYFNLVMNAVDAMQEERVGVLNVSAVLDGDRVVLRVRDTGKGMPSEKIEELLTDRESLDGELRSLGFVFVRQTVADLGGEISIESEPGKGTTVRVGLPQLPDGVPAPRKRSRCEQYQVHLDETPADEVAAGGSKPYGRLVHEEYERSQARFPGCIFAMSVTDGDEVDFFTVKPYEADWNITHEDLSPMFFQATVRGRLEEDEEKTPVLILKAPQNVREYFEYKELPEGEFSADRFVRMVHDEYVRVARKLVETGLPPDTGVQITDLTKFFPESTELDDDAPFPLKALARQALSGES